ncbi:ABC transporter permease [Lactobacillus sp. S2-2]|uniref:ECF transporter S component n=1 Tax=Lactobacillus sp. S2-2 TaxID=2692917 RepID=UPI001F277C91|nr:ECF transporter S component [Lactobacillus sp. S2-2]MCF6514670.1 ABC transporter permease [Lactobacillus sp. S2-2]
MNVLKKWHLKDIISIALIAVFSGVIFWGTGFLYSVLNALLTPIGLAPFSNEILFGLWTLAGPLAAFVIRIPLSSTLGEFLASAVEMIFGGQWGAATLISGLIQGLASEVGFAATAYKLYNWITICITTLSTTLITFMWSYFKDGYNGYSGFLIAMLFIVRLVSVFIFSGVLVKIVSDMIEKNRN